MRLALVERGALKRIVDLFDPLLHCTRNWWLLLHLSILNMRIDVLFGQVIIIGRLLPVCTRAAAAAAPTRSM